MPSTIHSLARNRCMGLHNKCNSTIVGEDAHQCRELLKSPNHQEMRELSPNATRIGCVRGVQRRCFFV